MLRRAVVPIAFLSPLVSQASTFQLPLTFEANRGQAPADVRYLGRSGSETIAFKDDAVVLPCMADGKQISLALHASGVRAEGATGGVANYYLGKAQTIEGLPLESSVRYSNVAPGIDLLFHGTEGRLEYDIEVAPGADASAFALHVSNGGTFKVAGDGTAKLNTGCESLRLLAPVAYQQIGGKRITVASQFRVAADGALTVDLAHYDHAQPLTIDPVVSYTKVYDKTPQNGDGILKVDAGGNIYHLSRQLSSDETDILSKISPSNTVLYSVSIAHVFSQYLTLDSSGNAYLAGTARDASYAPTTDLRLCSASDSSCPSGFVAKINSSGTIQYSTAVGGLITALTADASGNAYVVGPTTANALKTVNAYQPTFNTNNLNGANEVFFGKLNSSGTNWMYSSYFSSGDVTSTTIANVTKVALDASGNLYFAGSGTSVPLQNSLQSGVGEDFIAEFAPDGQTLLWSSLLGGTSLPFVNQTNSVYSELRSLSIGADGTIYISGATTAEDFPYTVNADRHPTSPITYFGASSNIFVTAINPAHTGFTWSTYLGRGDILASAIDADGNLYFGGHAALGSVPFLNPIATDMPGTGGYLLELSNTGHVLNATALGGRYATEIPTQLDIDSNENIYLSTYLQYSTTEKQNLTDPINIGTENYADQSYLELQQLGGNPFQPQGTVFMELKPANTPQISLSYGKSLVELRNASTVDLHITSIQGSAVALANSCGTTLAATTSCFILPAGSTMVTINSDATPTSQTFTLPVSDPPYTVGQTVMYSPAWIAFPATQSGTTSAAIPVTITNGSATPVPITPTATGNFSQTDNCPPSLASMASCTMQVSFKPGTGGIDSISSGVGTDVVHVVSEQSPTDPLLLSTIAGLNYGNAVINTTSIVRTVTITNTSNSPESVGTPYFTGDGVGAFSVSTSTCSATPLAPQQSCTIGFTFTPLEERTYAASINGLNGSQTVPLNGTGLSDDLQLSSTTITFPTLGIGQRSVQTVTVHNPGSSAVTISVDQVISRTGGTPPNDQGASPDYTPANDCGSSLASNATCTLTVVLVPTETGSLPASLGFHTPDKVYSISIGGTGVPFITLDQSSIYFGSFPLDGSAHTSSLTLTNQSTLAESFSIGTLSAPFSITNSTCTGSLAPSASCILTLAYTPTARSTQTATLAITSLSSSFPTSVSVPLSGNATGAVAQVSPASYDYGSVGRGLQSATQQFAVTNTGDSAWSNLSVSVIGANASDFTQVNNCPATLQLSSSCTISVYFKPSTLTNESASLQITGSQTNGTQTVPLTGTGVTPTPVTLQITPASLAFGNVVMSQNAIQIVQLKNTSSQAITLSVSPLATGNLPTPDYMAQPDCGGTVAAGATCNLAVTFTPSLIGEDDGSITLTLNASQPNHNTQVISATGKGLPFLTASPANIDFGAQYASLPVTRMITLANPSSTATAYFSIGSASLSAPYTVSGTTCPLSIGVTRFLNASASCTVSVTYTATDAGEQDSALTFTSSANALPVTVPLTASGSVPVIQLSATSYNFGSVTRGQGPASTTINLSNTGGDTITGLTIQVTGSNASDFTTSGCNSGSIQAHTYCALKINFAPTVTGAEAATITVSGSQINGTMTIALSGNGVGSPIATVAPSSVNISNITHGSRGSSSISVTNTGSDTLSGIAVSIAGSNAADFSQTNDCGTSLAVTARCTITVLFAPSTIGTENATLTFAGNQQNGTQTVSLAGTSRANATGQLSASSKDFGLVIHGSHATQTITLTNNGTDPLTGLAFAFTGTNASDFTQSNTCGVSVAGAASCTITLTFAPTTILTESATLSVTGNMLNSPQTVTLTGIGLPGLGITVPVSSTTVTSGSPASYSVALQPDSGLTGTVTFSCTGLPQYASCSFNPATITLPSSSLSTTLTVTTSSTTTTTANNAWISMTGLSLCLLCFVPFVRKRLPLLLTTLLIACSIGISGCGTGTGNSGGNGGTTTVTNKTPAGSYPFTVAAANGTTTQNISLTLTVQ